MKKNADTDAPEQGKKKKKIIFKRWWFWVLIVIIVIIIIAVASSGGGDDESTADSSGTADSAENSADESSDSEGTADSSEIVFESLTVVDNDECSIVITELDPNGVFGYTLEVELENKSSELTYMFAIRTASVDGVETDPLFASEVAAGKKSADEIYFTDTDLEENGLTDFTDIELTFYVYDSDDWLADPVAEETVHIYPYGEENASVFERGSLDTDTVLIDNDNITVIVTGYEYDSIWGYMVKLFLVNKTDGSVMFSVDEASVNGYMSDPLWAEELSGEKCAFSTIYWYDTELEEYGITDGSEIENIEFLLIAYDEDDFTYYAEEDISLSPEF